eukprot:2364223-Prymnesium_polylepis.1
MADQDGRCVTNRTNSPKEHVPENQTCPKHLRSLPMSTVHPTSPSPTPPTPPCATATPPSTPAHTATARAPPSCGAPPCRRTP